MGMLQFFISPDHPLRIISARGAIGSEMTIKIFVIAFVRLKWLAMIAAGIETWFWLNPQGSVA